MKRITSAIVLSWFAVQSAWAISTLPFYEPFPLSYGYAVLGTGASAAVWSIGNTGSSGGAQIVDYGGLLNYPNLANPAYSECLYFYGTPASNRHKGAPFTSQTLSASNRTVYASFLFMGWPESAPTNSRLFAALSSTGSGTTPSISAGVWIHPSGRLMLGKNSNATPSATNQVNAVDGQTHLVVLRYRWNPGAGDDDVALWVDPQALGVDEGSVPVPPAVTTNGVDVPLLQSFFVVHTTAASVWTEFVLDEIRVATNWAGVTPTVSGQPVPVARPFITQALKTANGLVVRGTNGPPNGAYQLLTATQLPARPYEWSVLTNGLFDAGGHFDGTGVLAPGEPRRFYRLLVGGEVPPAPVPPFILAPPTNLVVLGGQTATFTVVAAGDPPLAYQWYGNASSLLPGATNATLIITNAQFSDAGDYSVMVTNAFGSVTSAAATLTVNSVASGPFITSHPQSLTVTQGQGATFAVTATGTPPPEYQWHFNTNTALLDATNATLALTNVQPADAGAYSVSVANTNGTVTSSNAMLTVLIPPGIITPPAEQTIVTGQTALFTVAATGTAPLYYRWYFNGGTILPGATNAWLLASNAGPYTVVVSNNISSVTSDPVLLIVVPVPTNTGPVGFVTLNGGVTGGAGGPTVTVSNASAFATEVALDGPRIIQVQGTIALAGNVAAASDKTIVGLGTNATVIGGFVLSGVTNVIVRNLFFSNPAGLGTGDGVSVEYFAERIWIDHCSFYDCSDGALDITLGSDFVTVSWCKFYYTANTGHNFVNLIGGSQDLGMIDSGKFHVTFHHNWWSTLCFERMPRVRFGRVHVFNNYADCTGNSYCVRAGYLSELLVEGNYYDHINRPYEYYFETTTDGDTAAGLINATGNATPGCTNVGAFSDTVFAPPYAYALEVPATARAYVLYGAGAGTALFP